MMFFYFIFSSLQNKTNKSFLIILDETIKKFQDSQCIIIMGAAVGLEFLGFFYPEQETVYDDDIYVSN